MCQHSSQPALVHTPHNPPVTSLAACKVAGRCEGGVNSFYLLRSAVYALTSWNKRYLVPMFCEDFPIAPSPEPLVPQQVFRLVQATKPALSDERRLS